MSEPTEKQKMLAGALYLTRDVPAGATVFGNPARIKA